VKQRSGKLENWLLKDPGKNKSRLVAANAAGAKRALLAYELLESSPAYSLLKIELETGRSHQIRVQLSAIGHPVAGDLKYGAKHALPQKNIALFAEQLEFGHPVDGKRISLETRPAQDWFFPDNFNLRVTSK